MLPHLSIGRSGLGSIYDALGMQFLHPPNRTMHLDPLFVTDQAQVRVTGQ